MTTEIEALLKFGVAIVFSGFALNCIKLLLDYIKSNELKRSFEQCMVRLERCVEKNTELAGKINNEVLIQHEKIFTTHDNVNTLIIQGTDIRTMVGGIHDRVHGLKCVAEGN